MAAVSSYIRGIFLTVSAGACWSLGGIMLRSMDSATGWQVLFYRAIGMTLTLLVLMALRHRSRMVAVFRSSGRAGIWGGVCLATAFTTSIFSMLNTTVANTMFMQATQVFFAAGLGWVVLRERVRTATWFAMAVALTGVGVMVADGFQHGTPFGTLLSLVTGLTFAAYAVALRAGRVADMLPSACLAGLLSALAGGLMAENLAVGVHDLVIALGMGIIQFGLGFTLFTLGSRLIPSAELMLIGLSEVLLAPIWVWVGVGERASAMTLIGGGILVAAIIGLALSGGRRTDGSRDHFAASPMVESPQKKA